MFNPKEGIVQHVQTIELKKKKKNHADFNGKLLYLPSKKKKEKKKEQDNLN